ncbi:hypothetical protein GGF32_000373 [Allomyces javanicus]|nr:hypothetical protein GGF32_000373 [Allomyces javanicus]
MSNLDIATLLDQDHDEPAIRRRRTRAATTATMTMTMSAMPTTMPAMRRRQTTDGPWPLADTLSARETEPGSTTRRGRRPMRALRPLLDRRDGASKRDGDVGDADQLAIEDAAGALAWPSTWITAPSPPPGADNGPAMGGADAVPTADDTDLGLVPWGLPPAPVNPLRAADRAAPAKDDDNDTVRALPPFSMLPPVPSRPRSRSVRHRSRAAAAGLTLDIRPPPVPVSPRPLDARFTSIYHDDVDSEHDSGTEHPTACLSPALSPLLPQLVPPASPTDSGITPSFDFHAPPSLRTPAPLLSCPPSTASRERSPVRICRRGSVSGPTTATAPHVSPRFAPCDAPAATPRTVSLIRRRLTALAMPLVCPVPSPHAYAAIHSLDLSRNRLTALPNELADLVHLRHLNLSCNALPNVPACVLAFEYLETLLLSQNQIEQPLPARLGYMTALRVLKLDANRFHGKLPTSWAALTNLQTLALGSSTYGGNAIDQIPAGIFAHWLLLRDVDLSNNRLATLPDDLFTSPHLMTLTVERNRLETIPATVHLAPQLTTILAANNLLCALPPTLACCPSLQVLDLSENSLCFVPMDLIRAVRDRHAVTVLLTGNPFTRMQADRDATVSRAAVAAGILPECPALAPPPLPCTTNPSPPPSPDDPHPRGAVSLRELAARAWLQTHPAGRAPPKWVPDRLVALLTHPERISQCPRCAVPVVAEFLATVEVETVMGHADVPVHKRNHELDFNGFRASGIPDSTQFSRPDSTAAARADQAIRGARAFGAVNRTAAWCPASPWAAFMLTKSAFLFADYAALKVLRTEVGFPFACNMDVAYQFLVMAIERNDADLLDELLLQHHPQLQAYTLPRLLPALLHIDPAAPDRTRMASSVLQLAVTTQVGWFHVLTHPMIALLKETLRETLENTRSSARDIYPALSLFIFDILFQNTTATTAFLDTLAHPSTDANLLRLINKLTGIALDLHLVDSLHLLLTHRLAPNPAHFRHEGTWVPTDKFAAPLRILTPF